MTDQLALFKVDALADDVADGRAAHGAPRLLRALARRGLSREALRAAAALVAELDAQATTTREEERP